MFDVLVYLYENYWRPDACPEHDQLTRKLSSVGFESEEIEEALSWLDGVAVAAQSYVGNQTAESLRACDAEFLILLTGIDETFAQSVLARSSYKHDEIVWNAKFVNILSVSERDRSIAIDVGHLHEIENVAMA